MVKQDSGGRLQYIQCQQSREDPWFVQRMYYPEDNNYSENIIIIIKHFISMTIIYKVLLK
jgi:hypothetical protein